MVADGNVEVHQRAGAPWRGVDFHARRCGKAWLGRVWGICRGARGRRQFVRRGSLSFPISCSARAGRGRGGRTILGPRCSLRLAGFASRLGLLGERGESQDSMDGGLLLAFGAFLKLSWSIASGELGVLGNLDWSEFWGFAHAFPSTDWLWYFYLFILFILFGFFCFSGEVGLLTGCYTTYFLTSFVGLQQLFIGLRHLFLFIYPSFYPTLPTHSIVSGEGRHFDSSWRAKKAVLGKQCLGHHPLDHPPMRVASG